MPLPSGVTLARKRRRRSLIDAAKKATFLRLLIVGVEVGGYLLFASSSLLFDAIASLFDVVASFSLIFFIRIAAKPPDEDHPLGHGRFEPMAGLQLALLLVLIGGGLFFQQCSSLFHLRPRLPIHPLVWLISLGAVIVLEIAYRILHKAAKKEGSSALYAEAVHFRIDALSSLFATVALLVGAFNPKLSPLFDHLGALAISLLMICLGIVAALRNVHQLMDRVPDTSYFDLVRTAAMRVEAVRATEKLRIQLYGPDAHISIDIEVDPFLSVKEAHSITQMVRLEIQKSLPAARDVIVHLEPHLHGG